MDYLWIRRWRRRRFVHSAAVIEAGRVIRALIAAERARSQPGATW